MKFTAPCTFCGSPAHDDGDCESKRNMERQMAEPEGVEPWAVEWYGEGRLDPVYYATFADELGESHV